MSPHASVRRPPGSPKPISVAGEAVRQQAESSPEDSQSHPGTAPAGIEVLEALLAGGSDREAAQKGEQLLNQLMPEARGFLRTVLLNSKGRLGLKGSKSEALVCVEMLRHGDRLDGLRSGLKRVADGTHPFRLVDYGRLARRAYENLEGFHPNPDIVSFVREALADGCVDKDSTLMGLVEAGLSVREVGAGGFFEFAQEVVRRAEKSEVIPIGRRLLRRLLHFPEKRDWARGLLDELEGTRHAHRRDRLRAALSQPDSVRPSSRSGWLLDEFRESVLTDRSIRSTTFRRRLETALRFGGDADEVEGFQAFLKGAMQRAEGDEAGSLLAMKGLRRLARFEQTALWACGWESAVRGLWRTPEAQQRLLAGVFQQPVTRSPGALAGQLAEGLKRVDPARRRAPVLAAVSYLAGQAGGDWLQVRDRMMSEPDPGTAAEYGLTALELMRQSTGSPAAGESTVDYREDEVIIGDVSLPFDGWLLA